MSKGKDERCGRCGKDPADGYAKINEQRFCHQDHQPTCYMLSLVVANRTASRLIAEVERLVGGELP